MLLRFQKMCYYSVQGGGEKAHGFERTSPPAGRLLKPADLQPSGEKRHVEEYSRHRSGGSAVVGHGLRPFRHGHSLAGGD